ncbi:MAG: heparan-alpha-glucosaminide N-acetyltransferase [Beijerinckiaceae bacterium]|nr:heparan-alpha-glucosaminide N-acetyltransferase [Beijerinckiaceae bacterium]
MNPSRPRIEAVDAARGVALAAMGVYHFVWDLSFYNLVSPSTFYDPRFQMFGHIIAVSFLALVGVSLALAARGEFNAGAYTRRTALVAGAAALVSVGTYLFMPDAFIAFGILHCIAAASVIALAFLRAHWFVTFGAGVCIVLAPLVFASPSFDSLNWLVGLGVREPRTLDWRPLLPWTGFTLIGFGLAKALILRGVPESIAQWRARGGVARALSFGGRHSLAVYILHQPLLLAIVFVAATASANFGSVGANSPTQEADFRLSCTAECTAAGPERDFCERACDCVVRDAKNVGLWRQVLANSLTSEDRHRFDALTRACLRPDAEMIR